MYHCIVTNYGYIRKAFPTRIGNLFIDRLMPMDIRDDEIEDARGVVEDLRLFGQSDKLGFEVVVDDENGHPSAPEKAKIDYADYSINELRSIAAGKGVKDCFFMKKSDIILKLEEVQNESRP